MTQTEAICRCQCHEGQAVDREHEPDCSSCCLEHVCHPSTYPDCCYPDDDIPIHIAAPPRLKDPDDAPICEWCGKDYSPTCPHCNERVGNTGDF